MSLGVEKMRSHIRLNTKHGLIASVAASVLVLLTSCAQPPRTNGLSSADREAATQLARGMQLVEGQGTEKNPSAGIAIIQRLSDTGNSYAEMVLGNYYMSGMGVEKDSAKGIELLEKAAAQHNSLAEANLGFIYQAGISAPKDYEKASHFASDAINNKNPDGHVILARLYADGFEKHDAEAALQEYHAATAAKSSIAMLDLGVAYRDGKIVNPNKVVAFAWLDLAATNTKSNIERMVAERSRDQIALLLLPDELKSAKQLALDWKPGTDISAPQTASVPAQKQTANQDAVFTTQRASAPAIAPSDIGMTGKALSYDYVVAADGSFTLTIHREITINNRAAIQQLGQAAISFNNTFDTLEIPEAYTLKANGQKLNVAPASIITQTAPSVAGFPTFSDERQKVVLFPNVNVGDTTVLTAKYQSKPRLAGNFYMNLVFDPQMMERDVHVRITAPKSLPLRTETYDVKFKRTQSGNDVVYEWNWANTQPVRENIIALDSVDRLPRLFASSFQSYEQFAHDYEELTASKLKVTPAVQALANKITSGVTDKRKQAELIFDWVSQNIRYVLLYLGNEGSLIPHDVDSIIDNGYGDCKDHSLLFSALLLAKGIPSETVLINLGNSYALSGPPTLASLNHVITWLPDFGVYADTTAGVAPFGVLPFAESGKPVIHIASVGATTRRTPLPKTEDATISTKTTARMSADGKFTGDTQITATGQFAIALRQVALGIDASGRDQVAVNVLRYFGYVGTGKFSFDSPFDHGPNYKVSGHFEANKRDDILAGNSFRPPAGLALGWQPGEMLIGPIEFKDFTGLEPTSCYSGREEMETSIELPQNRKINPLPKNASIENKAFSYKSTWSMSGHTVTLKRELVSRIDQPVCVGELRHTTATTLNQIRIDSNTSVSLANH